MSGQPSIVEAFRVMTANRSLSDEELHDLIRDGITAALTRHFNGPVEAEITILPDGDIKIVALKEANPQAGRMTELVERFAEHMVLLSGDDPSACDSLLSGASGVISVVNNVIPEAFAQMVKLALSGDRNAASALDQQLRPLYAGMALASNPIPVKWALHKLGKIDSGIRLPLLPLDESMRKQLDSALQTLKTL